MGSHRSSRLIRICDNAAEDGRMISAAFAAKPLATVILILRLPGCLSRLSYHSGSTGREVWPKALPLPAPELEA